MKILDLKLYVFDLDGTVINSEFYHYSAYKKQVNFLSYNEYQRIFHNSVIKKEFIKKYKICKKQKEKDFKELYKKNYSYVEGFLLFLNKLILEHKEICIVTHSSKDRCDFINHFIRNL